MEMMCSWFCALLFLFLHFALIWPLPLLDEPLIVFFQQWVSSCINIKGRFMWCKIVQTHIFWLFFMLRFDSVICKKIRQETGKKRRWEDTQQHFNGFLWCFLFQFCWPLVNSTYVSLLIYMMCSFSATYFARSSFKIFILVLSDLSPVCRVLISCCKLASEFFSIIAFYNCYNWLENQNKWGQLANRMETKASLCW